MITARRAAVFLITALLALAGCQGRFSLVSEPTLPASLLTQFPAATASIPPDVQTATYAARLDALVAPALTATALPGRISTVQAQLQERARSTPTPLFTPTPDAHSQTLVMPETGGAPAEPATTPTPEPPDIFAGLRVEELAAGDYGLGTFAFEEVWERNARFTRSRVRYQSGGLNQYAFMSVPAGQGPFPVVIVLHDAVEPARYSMLPATTTRFADALAQAGYLVLHPNLRGFPPGDSGPNLFHTGYTLDVLNLIAYVENLGGQRGPLETADPARIGLFGQGLGAEVALRALSASPAVRAAVLYSPAGPGIFEQPGGMALVYPELPRSPLEQEAGAEELAEFNPYAGLERSAAALSLHTGRQDPLALAGEILPVCDRRAELGYPVECFRYAGEGHTFGERAEQRLTERVLRFFSSQLSQPVEP